MITARTLLRRAFCVGAAAATLLAPAVAGAFENPFATVHTEPPPLFFAGLHGGSSHDVGLGPLVGVAPFRPLRFELSYGYWTEHSFAALTRVELLPCAALTPYVALGYEQSIAALRFGLTLRTHRLVGGVGFEARIGRNAFVRAEMMGNGVLAQTLKDQKTIYDTTASDVFVARPGFAVGAYFP